MQAPGRLDSDRLAFTGDSGGPYLIGLPPSHPPPPELVPFFSCYSNSEAAGWPANCTAEPGANPAGRLWPDAWRAALHRHSHGLTHTVWLLQAKHVYATWRADWCCEPDLGATPSVRLSVRLSAHVVRCFSICHRALPPASLQELQLQTCDHHSVPMVVSTLTRLTCLSIRDDMLGGVPAWLTRLQCEAGLSLTL